jgi:hypothetical protein
MLQELNISQTEGDISLSTGIHLLTLPGINKDGVSSITHAITQIGHALDKGNPARCLETGGELLPTDQQGIYRSVD